MNSPVIIGKIAYDAGAAERGWKRGNGESLPQWEELEPEIQVAWAAAAEASIEAFKASQLKATTEGFGPAFSDMQNHVHSTAISKGWWDKRAQMENACSQYESRVYPTPISDFSVVANQISCLALVVTEIAEAIEAIRHGNPPDDKIPEFNGAEAECADAVIRLMDVSEYYGWRLSEAIVAKAEMNRGREPMHGGKLA